MFKPNSERKKGVVWKYFKYEKSSNKSRCVVEAQKETIGPRNRVARMPQTCPIISRSIQIQWRSWTRQGKRLTPAKESSRLSIAITTGCRHHLCTCITGREQVFSVCSDLTAGKRHRLTKTLEMCVFGKVIMKYYSWTVCRQFLEHKHLSVTITVTLTEKLQLK